VRVAPVGMTAAASPQWSQRKRPNYKRRKAPPCRVLPRVGCSSTQGVTCNLPNPFASCMGGSYSERSPIDFSCRDLLPCCSDSPRWRPQAYALPRPPPPYPAGHPGLETVCMACNQVLESHPLPYGAADTYGYEDDYYPEYHSEYRPGRTRRLCPPGTSTTPRGMMPLPRFHNSRRNKHESVRFDTVAPSSVGGAELDPATTTAKVALPVFPLPPKQTHSTAQLPTTTTPRH